MEAVYNVLLRGLEWVIEYSILLVDLVGVCVLLFAVGRAIWELCHKNRHVKLHLAEGIALSLEFKMGGELLRTGLVRDWRELLILGSIILLRAAMTFLIQWEIKNEKKHEDAHAQATEEATEASDEAGASEENTPIDEANV